MTFDFINKLVSGKAKTLVVDTNDMGWGRQNTHGETSDISMTPVTQDC